MKKIKLENLYPATSSSRKKFLKILTTSERYKEEIKKGIPFFSEEELVSIEKRYKDKGMTKKDIMAEIYKKGWLFKESTFKHYIQINQLPRAQRREKTNKGMISYYPPDTIRHLNFVRYCLFSKEEFAKQLNDILAILVFTDKDILENFGDGDNDCLNLIWMGIRSIKDGIDWAEEGVGKSFGDQPSKTKDYLKILKVFGELKGRFENEMQKFEKLLEKNTSPVDLDKLEVE